MDETYLGGVPYEVDIRSLEDRWPEPKKGDELSDGDIREVLPGRDSDRIYRVMQSWSRKLIKNRSLVLTRIRNIGWKIATNSESVAIGESIEERRRRQLKKEIRVHGTVEREKLSQEDARRHDKHEERLSKHIASWALDDSRPRGILRSIDRNGAERK